eukprot:COSAG02_NODE_56_length_43700_cov_33.650765_14_plen_80_part_00
MLRLSMFKLQPAAKPLRAQRRSMLTHKTLTTMTHLIVNVTLEESSRIQRGRGRVRVWASRQMLFKMGIMLFLMPKIMPA